MSSKKSKLKGAGSKKEVKIEPPIEEKIDESSTMHTKRIESGKNSVNNVISDIRLEDYTEVREDSWAPLIKIISGILILLVLYGFGNMIVDLFHEPEYTLAIAAEEITDENILTYAQSKELKATPGHPVYIKFQWKPGEIDADYLRIGVEKKIKDKYVEIANKGRQLPQTVTYLYFSDVFEPGLYRITVTNNNDKKLAQKIVAIQ